MYNMSSILFHNDTREINQLWYGSHKNLITSICIELGHVDKIEELSDKFLGKPLKIKAMKDPNKPKRPKTSYLYFCEEVRPGLLDKCRKKNQKIIIGDIAKELSKQWHKLSEQEKEKHVQQSLIDKQRYQDAMEQYNS